MNATLLAHSIAAANNKVEMFNAAPGVEINVEHFGEGKQTLVCLHGFGASVETWADIKPFLGSFASCFAVDLKGFGLSSRPRDGRYSLADQADVVTSLILAKQLSNVTLVGHSYGGAVALLTYFALIDRGFADIVRSLILIDSGGYLQGLPFLVTIPRTPIVNTLVVKMLPIRWQVAFTLKRLFFDQTKITNERIERYARFLRLPGSLGALICAAQQIIPQNSQRIIARIRELSLPTLIIWGRKDRAIPVDHAFRFHREIQGSELLVVENCGHVPQEEMPLETARAIRRFLTNRL